jgi:hypothetical protein
VIIAEKGVKVTALSTEIIVIHRLADKTLDKTETVSYNMFVSYESSLHLKKLILVGGFDCTCAIRSQEGRVPRHKKRDTSIYFDPMLLPGYMSQARLALFLILWLEYI